jgi:hypothetical protein
MAKKKTIVKPSKKASGATHAVPVKAKAPKKSIPPRSAAAQPTAVSNSQPKFATFAEAKNATIDALIRSIEEDERKLSAAKRAQSIDELPKVD